MVRERSPLKMTDFAFFFGSDKFRLTYHCSTALQRPRSRKKHWMVVFSVEIHFGLKELKARIEWMDNGQVKSWVLSFFFVLYAHLVTFYPKQTCANCI